MPSLRRQKNWLKRYCKARKIPLRKGFSDRSNKWGKPAERLWGDVLRSQKMKVTPRPTKSNLWLITPFKRRLIDRARAELGTKEWPLYSNWGEVAKYLKGVGITFPAPWCAAFVTYCVKKAKWEGTLPASPAWVPAWDVWGKKKGYEINKFRATRGDIVTFNWDSDSSSEHIGLIYTNFGPLKSILTVEGNATSSATPGGGVTKKYRTWRTINHVYRLPNYLC